MAKKILAMRKIGRTTEDMAEQLGLPTGKVRKVLDLCLASGILERRKSGRPRKLAEVQKEIILATLCILSHYN